MTFEKTNEERTQCVAYIDPKGLLRIRDGGRANVKKGALCLTSAGQIKTGYSFRPSQAVHQFYAGDRITLTF